MIISILITVLFFTFVSVITYTIFIFVYSKNTSKREKKDSNRNFIDYDFPCNNVINQNSIEVLNDTKDLVRGSVRLNQTMIETDENIEKMRISIVIPQKN